MEITRSPRPCPPQGEFAPRSAGEKIGGDRLRCIVAREDEQTLHDVAELADIARPVMRLKHRHCIVADLAHRQTGSRGEMLHEVRDKKRDVVATFCQ